MLPVKFCFIGPSGVRGKDIQKLTNQKQVIYKEDLPQMLPTKFWFICPSIFRGDLNVKR